MVLISVFQSVNRRKRDLEALAVVYPGVLSHRATWTATGFKTLTRSAGDISHKRPLLPPLMKIFGRLRMVSSI
jgi:hypothetical protein